MIILVDMDGVLADFDEGVLNKYRSIYPDKPFVSPKQRKSFYIKKDYLPELQDLVEEIYLSQGFYSNLPLIEGSLDSLRELSESNEVYICTSPLLENSFCMKEKFEWVSNYLGKDWTKRTIVSKDKTLIHGDLLIDDKPEIKGVQEPSWEHILYSQPYNEHIKSKRRITWKNWKEVLKL